MPLIERRPITSGLGQHQYTLMSASCGCRGCRVQGQTLASLDSQSCRTAGCAEEPHLQLVPQGVPQTPAHNRPQATRRGRTSHGAHSGITSPCIASRALAQAPGSLPSPVAPKLHGLPASHDLCHRRHPPAHHRPLRAPCTFPQAYYRVSFTPIVIPAFNTAFSRHSHFLPS